MTTYSRQDFTHLSGKQDRTHHNNSTTRETRKSNCSCSSWQKEFTFHYQPRYSYTIKNNPPWHKFFSHFQEGVLIKIFFTLVQEVVQSFWEEVTTVVMVPCPSINTTVLHSQIFHHRLFAVRDYKHLFHLASSKAANTTKYGLPLVINKTIYLQSAVVNAMGPSSSYYLQ